MAFSGGASGRISEEYWAVPRCRVGDSVIANQERVRAAERVKDGLERARAVGSKSGRPIGALPVVFDRARLVELRHACESWRTIASVLKVNAGTARAYSRAVQNPLQLSAGTSVREKTFTRISVPCLATRL
jgi:hypothetical protein